VVGSESFDFLITILISVQVVLLGDSQFPQNGSLKVKCLAVDHSRVPYRPFLSFLSVDCKKIL